MAIQVYGSGCPNCKRLFKETERIAAELKINAPVEYITDMARILELGVMSSPVLVIDGHPVLTGGGYSEEDIKNALQKSINKDNCACSECGCSNHH